MFSLKRIDSKKPCKLSMNTLLGLRIIVTFWKYYVSKLFTGFMLSVNTIPDGSAGANNPNNVSYVLSPTTAIKVARLFSSDFYI